MLWEKVYFRSKILIRPSIGEYWNISTTNITTAHRASRCYFDKKILFLFFLFCFAFLFFFLLFCFCFVLFVCLFCFVLFFCFLFWCCFVLFCHFTSHHIITCLNRTFIIEEWISRRLGNKTNTTISYHPSCCAEWHVSLQIDSGFVTQRGVCGLKLRPSEIF